MKSCSAPGLSAGSGCAVYRTMSLCFPIVQIAYFVNDAVSAAEKMAAECGAGPFYLAERIPLAWGEHRGQEQTFVHTSAYGQWGDVMLEMVQQDEEGPSPFRDMYKPGKEGIHHMAMMVDSLSETYSTCEKHGYTIAAKAATLTGTEFAFIDTIETRGHMLEIYERSEQLTSFYRSIRDKSIDWSGTEPVRLMDQLFK